jgi:D-alanyl-D-alanine carboxypeptidase
MSIKLIIPVVLFASVVFVVIKFGEPEPVPSRSPVIVAETPIQHQAQAFLLPAAQPAYVPSREVVAQDPAPDANAALVYHLETERVLFSKNETVRAPIASLTKVLTALVADRLLDPEEIVTVASKSVRVDQVRQTLQEGERIRVDDLIHLMLVESSNDAAYALSEHARTIGIDLVGAMNANASMFGMHQSYFTDPAGLDDEAYSTAQDLIRLVRAAVQQPHLWEIMLQPELTVQASGSEGPILHTVTNTNQLLADMEGIVWGKTGNTDGALGCMLLVVKIPEKDDTLVSIVLGSRSRFADTRLLVDWAKQAWQWR